ncbi:MAG: hypothetical protein ACREMY_00010 [bacterium]
MFRRLIPTLGLTVLFSTTALSAQQLAQIGSSSVDVGGSEQTIRRHEIRVDARNDEWTSTGFRLAQGDVVMVIAPGKVTVGALSGQVDADGVLALSTHEPGGNGGLYAKVGPGTTFIVGKQSFFQASEPGTLKLRVSDTRYDDNSGEYTVTVILIPGGLIPPPEPYQTDE